MKELKIYETCEIEIIPINDIITSSSGIDGDEDDFGYNDWKSPLNKLEW